MCCSIVILGTIDSRNAWIGRWSWLEGSSLQIGTLPIFGACVARLGLGSQQTWSVGPGRGGGLCGIAGPVWPADLVSGARGCGLSGYRLSLCGQQIWSVGQRRRPVWLGWACVAHKMLTPVVNLGEHRHREECHADDHFPLLVFD